MHPIKSIVARNQNFAYKHYGESKYGKRLIQFKDIHKGETCFVIGNGPSLKVGDLTRIFELGIPSFAFNRIFCIFDETLWRPTYYISQDINVTYGIQEQFRNLELKYKFLPIRWKWYEKFTIPNSVYYKTITTNDEILGFSKDFAKEVVDAPTVAYTAFQLAYYMGFKRIYLIGFDQNYKIAKDKDGNIVVDDKLEKDYVSEKYRNEETDDLIIPNLYEMNKAFISLDTHIKSGELDLEVYNSTRGGMLEVFERKDLDEVFKELENKI